MSAMKLFPYEGVVYDVHLDVSRRTLTVEKIENYDTGEAVPQDSEIWVALSRMATDDHIKTHEEMRQKIKEAWDRDNIRTEPIREGRGNAEI